MKTTDTIDYKRSIAIARVIPYRKNKRAIKAKWFEAIREMLHMENK